MEERGSNEWHQFRISSTHTSYIPNASDILDILFNGNYAFFITENMVYLCDCSYDDANDTYEFDVLAYYERENGADGISKGYIMNDTLFILQGTVIKKLEIQEFREFKDLFLYYYPGSGTTTDRIDAINHVVGVLSSNENNNEEQACIMVSHDEHFYTLTKSPDYGAVPTIVTEYPT